MPLKTEPRRRKRLGQPILKLHLHCKGHRHPTSIHPLTPRWWSLYSFFIHKSMLLSPSAFTLGSVAYLASWRHLCAFVLRWSYGYLSKNGYFLWLVMEFVLIIILLLCGKNKRRKKSRFDLWVQKISWRRKWQPTPVFLPGESHGRRSMVGYSPWGRKKSDTTELHFTSLHT